MNELVATGKLKIKKDNNVANPRKQTRNYQQKNNEKNKKVEKLSEKKRKTSGEIKQGNIEPSSKNTIKKQVVTTPNNKICNQNCFEPFTGI